MQPEGDTSFNRLPEKIKEITSQIRIPIIAKETGAGFAFEEAKLLETIGIKGIDVGGAGGTSWAAVESHRARLKSNKSRQKLGTLFWDWGIPTAVSTIEITQATRLTIIASGGIRSGVDVVKALALGADAVGLALPFLKPALKGEVASVLQKLINEIQTAMFLVGAMSVEDLKHIPLIITGRTSAWLQARGFKPETYARRCLP